MQVAGIVRPVTSAGPDDKLLHIENFGTNEGTKFEYRFSRFSFSRSSLLLPPFLSFFLAALRASLRSSLACYAQSSRWPTWDHVGTMTSWFDLSNDFSCMRELAFIKRLSFCPWKLVSNVMRLFRVESGTNWRNFRATLVETFVWCWATYATDKNV